MHQITALTSLAIAHMSALKASFS